MNTHMHTHPEVTFYALRKTHSPRHTEGQKAEGQQGDRMSTQACAQSCPLHSEQETHVHERHLNCPLLRSPHGWTGAGEYKEGWESPWLGAGVGVGNSLLLHPRRAEEEAREDKSVLPKAGGRGVGVSSG